MRDLNDLSPAHLKAMSETELQDLATEIRQFLIASVSQTGGHIGANLGTIELTIALHYVFDSPQDKILWDTGHQGYTHRILTGRSGSFPTLNSFSGMSRFLQRSESPHDILDATHAGTALSTAIGLALAMQRAGDTHCCVPVVGDGALGEGSTWEGLNYLASTSLPVLLVINDNGMAIPPTIGGITHLLTNGKTARQGIESLGLRYAWTRHGHNVIALIQFLQELRRGQLPLVFHVKTEKGTGLACAATHPYKMHFSMPFDPETGAGASPTIPGKTYATVASEALTQAMAADDSIMVLTPGTPYASGLEPLFAQFPDRVLDVGMAEQHAISMAAGLAMAGCKPVVCYQSTFLQRAYDQVLHDLCGMELPVTLLIARSGFAGYDGPTHHGLWDIPVLRSFPHMQIHYPAHSARLTAAILDRLRNPQGPMAILHAYEPVPDPERTPVFESHGLTFYAEGLDGTILCLGNMLATACGVREALQHDYGKHFGICAVSNIKPLPKLVQFMILPSRPIITLEEGIIAGGFGSSIREYLQHEGPNILTFGTADAFIPAGNKSECAQAAGLTVENIVFRIVDRMGLFKQDTTCKTTA